jgi:hypothetical protein
MVFTGSIGTKKYRPSIDDTDPIAVNFETGGEVTVRESCRVRLRQELSVRADRFQLVLRQAPQLFLSEPAFSEKCTQDVRDSRGAELVLAIDLFTAFGQVMFQVPHIGRLLDLAGHPFCFLNHLVKFPVQSSVEGFAGEGLF